MKAKKKTRTSRRSSFNRALSDAENRLNRALDQYDKARAKLTELNDQIPRLRRIIAALGGSQAPVIEPGEAQEVYRNLDRPVPEALKPFVRPTDLTGMASIPAPQPVQPSGGVAAPETVDEVPTDDNPNLFLRG